MCMRDQRGVHTAVGKQLDGVGDIAVLSRLEAGELACVKESVYVLDDESYRNYLIYKIWKNTNNCTYYDIIKAFRMFWDKPLYYREDPEIPATMILNDHAPAGSRCGKAADRSIHQSSRCSDKDNRQNRNIGNDDGAAYKRSSRPRLHDDHTGRKFRRERTS